MTGKRIVYYVLAGFIAATIFLIYIQYNSAKNINSLINGNEKFLDEYQVNSELKELEKDIITVENNVRGAVATNDTSHVQKLEAEVLEVKDDLRSLQKISDDSSTVKQVDELDNLVQLKLQFNKEVLDSFYLRDKSAAERLISTNGGKTLTDSISRLAQNIENTRHRILAGLAVANDKNGQRAQQFNSILIALGLACGAGLFWYIIITIRKQISLINQLNISEKKVKDAAQVKENFLANMSHEIRTPMNAIVGFTNLLQRQDFDEESKKYVQSIQRSGENLLAIINDILDLSKIEAGMLRIEPVPFNVRELLHSIEVMFKPKAVEKQLQFFVKVDESLPDALEGDAVRLTQILVNLIGNALKFTDKGSVSINISNGGISGDIINTHIIVSDTGIGIKKEELPTIFERFHQAEDSVTRKFGGTGLGLSIVKDLVLIQNGTIDVQSEPAKGTEFRLTIPYKISKAKAISNAPRENNSPVQSNFGGICVLAAEDNEINQSLLKHLFKSWKLNYELASNGREAIEKLREKKYDLILMDIQMPERDGYSTTQEIRNVLKLDTPIIAMTAHAMPGEREKCLSYGMNEYIPKPINEEHLLRLISQFTNTTTPEVVQNEAPPNADHYKYINLQYMKEVSLGNVEYEKAVTEQFLENIPAELTMVEKAWQHNHISDLRQRAHNMKTTVSVMGLNEVLQPYLDSLEYENLDEDSFIKKFSSVKLICEAAVEEAKRFAATI
jgi:signal transduction histidine kinase/CheY-like chemotaxis protein